jgi:acyl-CoA synthetase (AMP-forming)/AMP-acid ligase II
VLIDDYGRSFTGAQFRDEAARVAAGLVALGVGPGDSLSWQLPTVLEAPVLMAACARLGVVQNPIIPILREREVKLITEQVKTRLLVVPETWRGFAHGDMARALGAEPLAIELETAPGPAMRLPSGDPSTLPDPPTDNNACRWIYYSSGTTADPKGARHSDATVTASANGVVNEMGMRLGDVYPIAWPFSHIGGISMLSAALQTGATLALFDTWDPASTPERMAAIGATILGSATPFFMAYIGAQRRHGDKPLFSALRACVAGGAPTPLEVNREVSEVLGVRGVAGAWGLTEFPVATSETPDDLEIGTSVGWPAKGVTVRVVDGELRLKGPQCFLGYVDSSLDAAAFDEDGWFRTGDLGSVNSDGRVRIEGRLKDVIIRNAENISAQEVEEVVLRHRSVADVAVIGVPDPRTGERVCAVIVTESGHDDITLPELVQHCVDSGVAKYKCPEQLVFKDVLPRNPMGKILKNDLRTEVAENN